MQDKDKDKGSADLNNITPAKITLTKDDHVNPVGSEQLVVVKSRGNWLLPLLILILIAGIVFFVLPSHIESPKLENNSASSTTQTNPSSSSSSPAPQKPEASPFQEAQEARQRSKSQELLSEILRVQEELENNNVLVWAEESYNDALSKATLGDEAYRSRDFIESANLYGATLIELQSLLSDMDSIFSDSVKDGYDAINAGLSKDANEAFEFALLIYPDDEDAIKGLRRAETLDQVLQLMTDGNDLQQNDQLENAREKYQQVLKLDTDWVEAKQQLSAVNRKINDRDFNRLMSSGYKSLQQNNLEAARLFFQKAKRLKPNASEVLAALDQTQTGITNEQINQYLSLAIDYEKQEKWEEALGEYNKALSLDNNLAQAQEGKAYSDSRIKLDNRLNQIISEPGRLSNKSVFEETRLIVQQANSIPSPEPRLAQQLETINYLLNDATNPVNVMFMSDNQTNVRINRVGMLGTFEQTKLDLLPGKYTAVGTRKGYRDIRIEFNVPANQLVNQAITIIATEQVSSR